MAATNHLDCTVYVQPTVSKVDLAGLLADLLGGAVCIPTTVTTSVGDIEVRRNSARGGENATPGPDGFLFFQNLLEVYPDEAARHEEVVGVVEKILTFLWSRGWPAVAACDYEDKLPCCGGYGTCPPWLPNINSEYGKSSVDPRPVERAGS